MHRLDEIDHILLRALQTDGRMSNVDLAEKAGISAPPCLRRLRHLEESGYIKSYSANLDAEKMGYSISAFIQISLASTKNDDLQAFMHKIQEWDHVREAYALAGDCDFLLKIVARNWDDYQDFLLNILPTAPAIGTNKSYLAVKAIKTTGGVPV